MAEAGLSVVGVQGRLVGGEYPYWGCVPSKMMIRAANLLVEARRIPGMAGDVRVAPDWAPVAARIRDGATDDWNETVAVERLERKGGRFVRGWGRLAGPGRVRVGDRVFEASRAVVIGTGAVPAVPAVPLVDGLAGTPYWTNREALEAKELPESLVVLGGGAVGLELAQAYARFGAAVTVVEALDRVLPVEEPEASAAVEVALEADGIVVRTSARASSVAYDRGFTVTLGDGGEVTGERLLVAVGRRVDLSGLGVDTVGLDPAGKALQVDDRMRAGEKLWGVGDVTGRGAVTHVAMYQAGVVVRDILGQDGSPGDYRALPRVTFTDPEVGAVGPTEAQARDVGVAVQVGLAQVPSTARGWIHKAGNDGIIKLVADTDRGVLVGAAAAKPTGSEVLAGLAVAVHGEVPVERLRHMIYAYPTFHRGIEDATRDVDTR